MLATVCCRRHAAVGQADPVVPGRLDSDAPAVRGAVVPDRAVCVRIAGYGTRAALDVRLTDRSAGDSPSDVRPTSAAGAAIAERCQDAVTIVAGPGALVATPDSCAWRKRVKIGVPAVGAVVEKLVQTTTKSIAFEMRAGERI